MPIGPKPGVGMPVAIPAYAQYVRPARMVVGTMVVPLKKLVADLVKRYPEAKVRGHRDFDGVAKACPCFNAMEWAAKNGFPTPPQS